MIYVGLGILAILLGGLLFFYQQLKRRHLVQWLPAYVRQASRRRSLRHDDEIHVILCLCDHYEPKAGGATPDVAQARVETWVREYPRQFARFRDSDGRPPRYSFFYPAEEYEPEYLEALADLCRQGFGEVEVHLHHDNDTPEGLRAKLVSFTELLSRGHGLLSRHKDTGELAYGFIHGNWTLCNSRPDGKRCGVNNELAILRDTGCYADFTYPSAPHPTQPPKINSIYYACDKPGQPCSHHTGWDVGTGPAETRFLQETGFLGPAAAGSLLLVQGPLMLDWRRRKWGVLPHVENGCLQETQPPSMVRLDHWLRARVQVPARPDWFFVKLHAHGAPEACHQTLLGEPMVRFHAGLAERAQANPRFHYHYVTAREMYNLIKAAEAGFRGPVRDALDYLVVSNIEIVSEARTEGEKRYARWIPGTAR